MPLFIKLYMHLFMKGYTYIAVILLYIWNKITATSIYKREIIGNRRLSCNFYIIFTIIYMYINTSKFFPKINSEIYVISPLRHLDTKGNFVPYSKSPQCNYHKTTHDYMVSAPMFGRAFPNTPNTYH